MEIIIWYLVGVAIMLVATKIHYGEFIVDEIPSCLVFGIFGPWALLVVVASLVCIKADDWMDSRGIDRNKRLF